VPPQALEDTTIFTLLEGDTIFGSLKTVQLTCAVVLLYAYDLKFT